MSEQGEDILRVLIFGGTTEGRQLAEQLAGRDGYDITVSVATPVGAEELAALPTVHVLVGRLDEEDIAGLLPDCDVCVDATHPYATEISANVAAACARKDRTLLRLLRASDDEAAELCARCVQVVTCSDAASYLEGTQGRVLLTVGSQELSAFARLGAERLVARVLPTHDGIAACEAVGLPHRSIIALEGPFSQELNEALMRDFDVAWMVTKDSGVPGGFIEKLRAAAVTGVHTIVVGRPPTEAGLSLDEVLSELEHLADMREEADDAE